jgi:hypothetical protein
MGDKPSNKEVVDTTKEYQREEKGGADSTKQFRDAGHQARNDYQDSGSPFGPLSNRDRSEK